MKKIVLTTLLIATSALWFQPSHGAEILKGKINIYNPKYKFELTPTDTTLKYKYDNENYLFKGDEALQQLGRITQQTKRRGSLTNRWKWDEGRYMGVNVMYSGLIQNLGHMQLPSDAAYMQQTTKSIGVDINIIDAVLFSYRRFGIVTGLGFEINNFRFDNNISLMRNSDGYVVPDNSFTERGIELSKSKLTTCYMNIPLLLQFKLSNKGWISAGVVGGMRLSNHTKVKAPEIGIQKSHDNLNLRNFHYGFQASVGYGMYSMTAKYYPQSIFRPGFGPNVQQVSIGIGIDFNFF